MRFVSLTVAVVLLWTLVVVSCCSWLRSIHSRQWLNDQERLFLRDRDIAAAMLANLEPSSPESMDFVYSVPPSAIREIESALSIQLNRSSAVSNSIVMSDDPRNRGESKDSGNRWEPVLNRQTLPSGVRLTSPLPVKDRSLTNSTGGSDAARPATYRISRTVSEDASSVAASRSWLALAPWICVWLVGLVVAWRFDIQRRRRRSTLSEILRNWRNQITLQTRRFETQTTKTKRLPAFARISNTTEDRDFELEDSAQLIDSTRLFQPLSSDILWLNRSIASQLQTLHQTHQQNERLCTILESMKEGVVSVDNSLQVTLLNTSAQKLLDLRHAEAGSQLVETIRDPRIHSLAKQTLESGLPRTLDLAFGSEPERHVRLRTSLITEETPPFENQSQQSTIKLGVLLIAADITQLIRLEKMRREFTANVSHELKTPLAAIRAYTETLLLGAIDDQENNRRFLNEIDEQSERLESLVADLLELSRIQQASEVSAEPLDVRQLIWNTSTRWKVIASSRQIDFQILDATEDLTIKSDKKSFETVLDNLISNAIRYTNPGGQVIVQSQRTPTETGHAVLISIRDTGIGIPGEDAERIFERFYRVEKARSVALGGTGLGLSIVKNLVSMMGGKITVESEVNVGSTFHVSFPENST